MSKLKQNCKEWVKIWKQTWLYAVPGNQCEVCGKELRISVSKKYAHQVARFHKECRAFRYNPKAA